LALSWPKLGVLTTPSAFMKIPSILLAFLLPLLISTHAEAKRGMDVRDLVNFERVSSPLLSPDGRTVVYALRQTDFAANKANTSLWRTDGKTPVRITPEGFNVNSPAFSIDGLHLYFMSAKSGSMQLWKQALGGGEPIQVSNYALDMGSYKFSPDGKILAFNLEVFNDCADVACTKKRLDEAALKKSSGVVHSQLFIRHWDTWADGRRNQLFTANLGSDGKLSGEPKKISQNIDGDVPSKPFGDAAEYTFSPDGKTIVFSARIAGKTEAWSTNFDLYSVAADGSTAPKNLTADNPAWDTGPVFSHDGKVLYYRAMKRATFEADRFGIMTMDLATGAKREINEAWDRSADSLALSKDGQRLLTDTDDLGTHALFMIDIATGRAHKMAGDGNISGYDVVGDQIVFSRSNLTEPAQLYRGNIQKDAKFTRITNFNADKLKDIVMGSYEQFNFKGWNNETVHGYVVKPHNYVKGKKYPTAFLIHGGPQGSFGDNFHYRWNAQTYAGMGFAVVMIDFHGSTGYGQKFTDSISGDWGGKPLEDLQKGWAAAQEKYSFIDGQRACALGGSYGGYMANWIAGKWPEGFKCLVSHAGIMDNRTMGYSTEELWFDEWEMQGTPYEKPENYERYNPVNHVVDWKAPMLVIHGQLDYRIPVEQGIATFTALQRRGIDSQFLYFPDENHWILKPHNSVLWHDTVNAWLKKHTVE
jgi:dipeptidyl aminopeptidase/acylaminoacyl peptidase